MTDSGGSAGWGRGSAGACEITPLALQRRACQNTNQSTLSLPKTNDNDNDNDNDQKPRFAEDQAFTQAQETQIRTMDLVEGGWYVKVTGDPAGRVSGAVYPAAADGAGGGGNGGADDAAAQPEAIPVEVRVCVFVCVGGKRERAAGLLGCCARSWQQGLGDEVASSAKSPPATCTSPKRNRRPPPLHITHAQPAWDSCKTRRATGGSLSTATSPAAAAARRLQEALGGLKAAVGEAGARELLTRALVEAADVKGKARVAA